MEMMKTGRRDDKKEQKVYYNTHIFIELIPLKTML